MGRKVTDLSKIFYWFENDEIVYLLSLKYDFNWLNSIGKVYPYNGQYRIELWLGISRRAEELEESVWYESREAAQEALKGWAERQGYRVVSEDKIKQLRAML